MVHIIPNTRIISSLNSFGNKSNGSAKPVLFYSVSYFLICMKVDDPKAISKANKWHAIPPEMAPLELPFLAMTRVVSPSGNALPIDNTTIPKNDYDMSKIIPIKFIPLTKISQSNLFHRSPFKIEKTIFIIKYDGIAVSTWGLLY